MKMVKSAWEKAKKKWLESQWLTIKTEEYQNHSAKKFWQINFHATSLNTFKIIEKEKTWYNLLNNNNHMHQIQTDITKH